MRVRDGTRAEKRAATTKYIDSFNLSVETPSRGVSTGYERRSAVGRYFIGECSNDAAGAQPAPLLSSRAGETVGSRSSL